MAMTTTDWAYVGALALFAAGFVAALARLWTAAPAAPAAETAAPAPPPAEGASDALAKEGELP